MKRVRLLSLLDRRSGRYENLRCVPTCPPVLPTAASAHTIDFTADSTSLSTNFINVGEAGVSARVVGPKYTIELFSGPATLSNGEFVDFTSGTLTVTNTSTGALVFGDCVTGGDADIHGNPFTINGAGLKGSFSFKFFGGDAEGAGASVYANMPEPSALEGFLLGTGVLGLAEMMRRKLRLGT